MEKQFWQSIVESEYMLPQNYSLSSLTSELLSLPVSLDPEMRQGPAYSILDTWIHRGYYSHAQLWQTATQLLHNLTVGLGEQETDSVFLRSFSLLILSEIIYYDLTSPTLDKHEIEHLLESALAYVVAEKDVHGYEPDKGWVHTIAHAADFLWVLAQNRFVTVGDLERIMNVIATRVTEPVAFVYLYDEDERLVRTVMGILQRDLLKIAFLATWLQRLTQSPGRIALSADFESGQALKIVGDTAETCARHNTKHFLRSLYFQLREPGFAGLTFVDQSPSITASFLPHVEQALQDIKIWC